MKTKTLLVSIFILLLINNISYGQTITIDGYAYLEGQTNHDSIKILFKRTAPSALIDSTYTINIGYFSKILNTGIYDITYSKNNFIPILLVDYMIFSNTTMSDTILEQAGLNGQLSDTLSSGTYIVGGDIEVASDDTLVIQPGVVLLFKQDVRFNVNGLLIAEGTLNDSIVFTRFEPDITWGGIQFNSDYTYTASDSSIISYALIEYSNNSGICLRNVSPSIRNSTIRYNTGYYYSIDYDAGGGIFMNESDARIENTIICNNEADKGGGIYCNTNSSVGNRPVIANCLINNNVAIEGCGIYFYDWYNKPLYPVLINSTITKNSGGDAAVTSAERIPILINNIISFNDSYGIMTGYGNCKYIGYCNIWNNSSGNFINPPEWVGINVTINQNGDSCDVFNNISIDPLFVDFQNNNYHLQYNSPCIDAGSNDSVTAHYDLDGNIRFWDGNGDGDTIVDMGVYEIDTTLYVYINDFLQEHKQNLYEIYPNPSSGKIYIKKNSIEKNLLFIKIFDNKGSAIYNVNFVNNRKIYQVDMSNYPKGLYFIKLVTKYYITTKKIIIY